MLLYLALMPLVLVSKSTTICATLTLAQLHLFGRLPIFVEERRSITTTTLETLVATAVAVAATATTTLSAMEHV